MLPILSSILVTFVLLTTNLSSIDLTLGNSGIPMMPPQSFNCPSLIVLLDQGAPTNGDKMHRPLTYLIFTPPPIIKTPINPNPRLRFAPLQSVAPCPPVYILYP